jgi:16S rRNA C967 or C1407 C5-methylase (RsmB/RsmF family)
MGQGLALPVLSEDQGPPFTYTLDRASLLPPLALDVSPGQKVLDMCAAPGGKSLLLAEALFAAEEAKQDLGGELVCNEISDGRRQRLNAVLFDYLPQEVQARVRVTSFDGAKWCLYEQEAFDRVLVDAPCSGERHLLAATEELRSWSPTRGEILSHRQVALLMSALRLLRPGGRVVYSTCSVSPRENDEVIERVLEKAKGRAQVASMEWEFGEKTAFGWTVLPDRCEGAGPIFFSALERTHESFLGDADQKSTRPGHRWKSRHRPRRR